MLAISDKSSQIDKATKQNSLMLSHIATLSYIFSAVPVLRKW